MAGYSGYRKSNNAVLAEKSGKLPLSRAISVVAKTAGVTRKVARAALEETGPCEWHHTSKHYNKTEYYSLSAAQRFIAAQPILEKFPPDWEERMNAARTISHLDSERIAKIERADDILAAELGVTKSFLTNAFYNTWEDEDVGN